MSDFLRRIGDAGLAVFATFLVPIALAGVAAAALLASAAAAAFAETTLIVVAILFVVWLILHFILAKKAICGCDEGHNNGGCRKSR
ncbi:hypothetical protein [Halobacillus mangrovi]|uniref:Uncharacterized protein n=1 Tax=Halobacillus mangrovi TaxID=402384 RepID=A0A1W6A099_9BACI|nr:hypothetical protein [Halobacillus mangrovi]ARI79036.1 hypothetical protein HM131_20360 [Halobacillus mangrovi]